MYCLRSSLLLILSFLVLIMATDVLAQREPVTPDSDDEVLVVLPQVFLANRNELSELRERLNSNPDDPKLSADVASRYLAMGNRTGEPRYYGYARAAISNWWETDATAAVLKIRAKLKEKDHLYDDALADLQLAVKQSPDDAQALIEIGNIYRVKGKYAEAMKIGDRLQSIAGEIPAALCRAPVMAQTGNAQEAYDLLSKILPEAKEKFPSTVQFILTIRAEIADALGRSSEVKEHFTDGLARDAGDTYLLRGYGDFLLDQGKPAEALTLLREHTNDTGAMLRAAIAARESGEMKLANQWTEELETRFEEIRLRGALPHGRFESRLELKLKDDPKTALKIALENWQKQKEVRDSRHVLEAAIAAKDPAAAKPVVEFLKANRNEHVTLKKLLQQLEGIK